MGSVEQLHYIKLLPIILSSTLRMMGWYGCEHGCISVMYYTRVPACLYRCVKKFHTNLHFESDDPKHFISSESCLGLAFKQ